MSQPARPQNLFSTPGFEDLGRYTGTDNYWRSGFVYKDRSLSYTDGVQYVAEKAKAYWLIDMCLSHAVEIYKKYAATEPRKFYDVLVCELTLKEDSDGAVFMVYDGDRRIIALQDIQFTYFPAAKQVFWIKEGILMLPSEY